MLFGQLNPDIFTVFSGSNRALYERALATIYETYFRADLLFPTDKEIVGSIYDCLAADHSLWRDEEGVNFDELETRRGRRLRRKRNEVADAQASSEAFQRARTIYNRLVQTGWLEESRYGLRITVDMPSGAMRLAEFLCSLRDGISEQLGGLVIEVKTALDAVRVNARENALGLNKAARDATAFGRYLRSVLSALRDIDRQVRDSGSVGARLRHYFEDFVEKVLLKDYAAIATTSHPYRFRHRIFEALESIEDSPADVAVLGEVYLEARLASDEAAAHDVVHDDLFTIRRVFDRIEEAFNRIQQHRARLETRLRNTVRYAGRRTGAFLQRSEPLFAKLDRLAERRTHLMVEGLMEARHEPMSPFLLARPRTARAPIEAEILVLPTFDPIQELRKALEREYLNRLVISPAQVSRFLEKRVPPFGHTNAATFRLNDVDDFLVFDALRLIAKLAGEDAHAHPVVSHLAQHFAFEPDGDGQIDNEWITCGDFKVVRKGDHVTVGAADAH